MQDNKNHMEAIYSLLINEPQIFALVGANIFPSTIPQKNGLPAIVYSQLSEDRQETKDGAIPNGHRFTLEVYADADDPLGGYPKVQNISNATKNLLQWYDGIVDGIKYKVRFLDQTDGTFEEPTEVFKIVQEFNLKNFNY